MILFVDDEKRVMSSYTLELILSGYEVDFETNVDDAMRFFTNNLEAIKVLVLDIMLAPGDIFKNADTEGGMRTGINFYQLVRKKAPELPVFIFTNVSDEQVAKSFRKEPRCWFGEKKNYLPWEFAEEVKRVVQPPKKEGKEEEEED
jgi:DNA-binding response OmpR family regulator